MFWIQFIVLWLCLPVNFSFNRDRYFTAKERISSVFQTFGKVVPTKHTYTKVSKQNEVNTTKNIYPQDLLLKVLSVTTKLPTSASLLCEISEQCGARSSQLETIDIKMFSPNNDSSTTIKLYTQQSKVIDKIVPGVKMMDNETFLIRCSPKFIARYNKNYDIICKYLLPLTTLINTNSVPKDILFYPQTPIRRSTLTASKESVIRNILFSPKDSKSLLMINGNIKLQKSRRSRRSNYPSFDNGKIATPLQDYDDFEESYLQYDELLEKMAIDVERELKPQKICLEAQSNSLSTFLEYRNAMYLYFMVTLNYFVF